MRGAYLISLLRVPYLHKFNLQRLVCKFVANFMKEYCYVKDRTGRTRATTVRLKSRLWQVDYLFYEPVTNVTFGRRVSLYFVMHV